MKNNIIIVRDLTSKIDFDLLVSNRIEEVQINKEFVQNRVLQLLPYVTECLFGLANAHNTLYNKTGVSFYQNEGYIDDINSWVKERISFDSFTTTDKGSVSYKKNKVYLWLSDNPNCMRYTNNPIFQSFINMGVYANTTEEYVKIVFEEFLKDNL